MRLSNPDLRALHIFRSIVENHGFRGAQLALGVSPSAISTYVKALEDRLGFELCRRGKGGFRLSEKGRLVYEACRTLGGALSAFEMRMGELRNKMFGTLSLGVSANTVTEEKLRIFEVVRLFEERHYDVFFDIAVLPTEALERGLTNGEFQLAIAPFINRLDDLSYRKLYVERHRLYCGSRHLLFRRADSTITLADLSRERLVTRAYMNQTDLAHFKNAKSAASVSSMEAQLILILSGCYIGYLADHYAAPWVRKRAIRELSHADLEFLLPFFLARPRRQSDSLVIKTFCDDLFRTLKT